jgi:DNA-binding LytR/AlgR family response regulator
MINILICDDDSSFAARLKNLSEQYFSVHGIPAAVSAFSDADEIGSETFASCDIALLDIDYVSKPYNGLDVARRLRAVRKDAVLIFITNYVEYAPEGYEVRAFRYLLKSEIDRKFAPCLTQAVACLRTESPKLKLSCEGEIVEIDLQDLLYVESVGHTLIYHLKDRQYSVYSSLSKAEAELTPRGFLRIQKSFLVNMAHLKKLTCREALLTDGEALSVSEKNYASLKRRYLLFKGM